jgi:hypothetical protein
MHYSTSTTGYTLWLALGVDTTGAPTGTTGIPLLPADRRASDRRHFRGAARASVSSRRCCAVRNSASRSQGLVGGEMRDYGSVRSSGLEFVSQPDQIPDGWIDVVGPVRRDRPWPVR